MNAVLDEIALELNRLENLLHDFWRQNFSVKQVIEDEQWQIYKEQTANSGASVALRCAVCDVEYCPLLFRPRDYRNRALESYRSLGCHALFHLGGRGHGSVYVEYFYCPCCSEACEEICYELIDKIEEERVIEWQQILEARKRLKTVRSWLRRSQEVFNSQNTASALVTTSRTS